MTIRVRSFRNRFPLPPSLSSSLFTFTTTNKLSQQWSHPVLSSTQLALPLVATFPALKHTVTTLPYKLLPFNLKVPTLLTLYLV
jgi:hypothetical protein